MSTRRSNGRPEDRPIRMATTAEKCMRCRKWKMQGSFNLSSSNLFATNVDIKLGSGRSVMNVERLVLEMCD